MSSVPSRCGLVAHIAGACMQLCRRRPFVASAMQLAGAFLIAVATAIAQGANGDVDVHGSWVSEPTLGQLGFTRISYTFGGDEHFRQRIEFLSFCGIGAVQPDCVYYWHVVEGRYRVAGSTLTLQLEKMSAVLQQVGSESPTTSDLGLTPTEQALDVQHDADGLVVRYSKGEPLRLRPGPAIE